MGSAPLKSATTSPKELVFEIGKCLQQMNNPNMTENTELRSFVCAGVPNRSSVAVVPARDWS